MPNEDVEKKEETQLLSTETLKARNEKLEKRVETLEKQVKDMINELKSGSYTIIGLDDNKSSGTSKSRKEELHNKMMEVFGNGKHD